MSHFAQRLLAPSLVLVAVACGGDGDDSVQNTGTSSSGGTSGASGMPGASSSGGRSSSGGGASSGGAASSSSGGSSSGGASSSSGGASSSGGNAQPLGQACTLDGVEIYNARTDDETYVDFAEDGTMIVEVFTGDENDGPSDYYVATEGAGCAFTRSATALVTGAPRHAKVFSDGTYFTHGDRAITRVRGAETVTCDFSAFIDAHGGENELDPFNWPALRPDGNAGFAWTFTPLEQEGQFAHFAIQNGSCTVTADPFTLQASVEADGDLKVFYDSLGQVHVVTRPSTFVTSVEIHQESGAFVASYDGDDGARCGDFVCSLEFFYGDDDGTLTVRAPADGAVVRTVQLTEVFAPPLDTQVVSATYDGPLGHAYFSMSRNNVDTNLDRRISVAP